MKTKLFLALLCICFFSFSHAQDGVMKSGKPLYPEDKRWMMNFSPGMNIDLSGSSSNPYSELLGSRRETVLSFKYRLTHLTSKRFGWYADIQMNFYRERRSEYLKELQAEGIIVGIIESIYEGLGEGLSFVYPSASAGVIYRLEYGRWKIHPELGIGYGVYLMDREKRREKIDNDGVLNNITYTQHAHSLFLNVGMSANYFISRRCFFVLNASFQRPLQKSSAKLNRSMDGVETDKLFYETSRIGKSLNTSLGFGFIIGRYR